METSKIFFFVYYTIILFMIRYQISLSSFYTYSLFRNTSFHYDEIIIRKSTKKIYFKIHMKCFFYNKHENKIIWEFDK